MDKRREDLATEPLACPRGTGGPSRILGRRADLRLQDAGLQDLNIPVQTPVHLQGVEAGLSMLRGADVESNFEELLTPLKIFHADYCRRP